MVTKFFLLLKMLVQKWNEILQLLNLIQDLFAVPYEILRRSIHVPVPHNKLHLKKLDNEANEMKYSSRFIQYRALKHLIKPFFTFNLTSAKTNTHHNDFFPCRAHVNFFVFIKIVNLENYDNEPLRFIFVFSYRCMECI